MKVKTSTIAYDVIGDIHGEFGKFQALMSRMGYRASGSSYVPPVGRRAVFVGDLIDRGPEQVRLLKAVRGMIDAGHAHAVMGNHELNAIAFITEDPDLPGEFLRKNQGESHKSVQNRNQHRAFLEQVGEGSAVHRAWVEWFRTLPLHLDLGGIRVAHAWWDDNSAQQVDDAAHRDAAGRLTDNFMRKSHKRGSALKKARKILTTGYEHKLPPGQFVTDKEGNKHDNARLKMWRHDATRLREIAIVPGGDVSVVPDLSVREAVKDPIAAVEGSPIFVGHYWFKGDIRLESDKVAVLDWSAAADGPLVAYRWDGEHQLANDKFVAAGV